MFAPSFWDHLADRLEVARYDVNQEWLMRRLTEPALVNGVMQPIGYEFESDGSPGPHRRTDGHSFKYHPQFEEVGEATVPFPSAIHSKPLDIAA
jgi:hypothetical protein